MKAFVVQITEDLTPDEIETWLGDVSEEKGTLVRRLHFARDRQNTLAADLLARFVLCQKTGLRNRELRFSKNAFGKPLFQNEPSLHYNVSHSGRWVALAVAGDPVGIDIEGIRPVNLRIARRFFAEDEARYVFSAADTARDEAFLEIWTKKESYVKYLGKGLTFPLPSFSVLDENHAGLFHLIPLPGAKCHVCGPGADLSVVCMDLRRLLAEFARYR